jgi:hypothetical protein
MDRLVDRRSCRRAPYQSLVEVVHGDLYLPCCPSFDLSEGGVRLGASLPHGSEVKLLIPLAHDDSTRASLVRGEVAWRDTDATGVRFVNLPAETGCLIRGYVQAQGPSGGAARAGAPG